MPRPRPGGWLADWRHGGGSRECWGSIGAAQAHAGGRFRWPPDPHGRPRPCRSGTRRRAGPATRPRRAKARRRMPPGPPRRSRGKASDADFSRRSRPRSSAWPTTSAGPSPATTGRRWPCCSLPGCSSSTSSRPRVGSRAATASSPRKWTAVSRAGGESTATCSGPFSSARSTGRRTSGAARHRASARSRS